MYFEPELRPSSSFQRYNSYFLKSGVSKVPGTFTAYIL